MDKSDLYIIKKEQSREIISKYISFSRLQKKSIINFIQSEHSDISVFIDTVSAMICFYFINCKGYPSDIKIASYSTFLDDWFNEVLSYILRHKNPSIRSTMPRIREGIKFYLDKIDNTYYDIVIGGFDSVTIEYKNTISWEYIKFKNGYLLIFHPEHPDAKGKYKPFRYVCLDSIEAFNHVNEYIKKKLHPIQVLFHDDVIVGIDNKSVVLIQEAIIMLDDYSKTPEIKVVEVKNEDCEKHKGDNFTNEQIKDILKSLKSKYLNHLSKLQLNTEKLYYCIEQKINSAFVPMDEEAFLFSIKQTGAFTLMAFENVLPSRATILFVCANEKINESITFIHEYFSSPQINKRENLIIKKLDLSEYGIISYVRVMHDSYPQWVKVITEAMRNLE